MEVIATEAPSQAEQEARAAMRSEPVRVAHICPSPTNPRKTFVEHKHLEMVESIKKHGVLQPILLRLWPADYPWTGDMPLYELVAGERRYRAAKAAGVEFVPALVKTLTDVEVVELQIVENLHRDDLNALEEADGFNTLLTRCGISAAELAEKIGKSRGYIYARLKLLALGEEGRRAHRQGEIDTAAAVMVARLPPGLQSKCLCEITGQQMTHRMASKHIQLHYMLDLKTAPFPGHTLQITMGHCQDCERRTGNQPDLYRDVRSADVCTDPGCYAEKKAYHLQELANKAREAGQKMIAGEKAAELLRHGIEHMSGWKALDAKCYDHTMSWAWGTPYRELLQDSKIAIHQLPDPKSGKLVEVAEEGALRAAIKRIKESENPAPKEEAEAPHITAQKAHERAARLEAEYRRELLARIRAAMTQEWRGVTVDDLIFSEMRLIARQFWSRTGHEGQKKVARAWTEALPGPFADDHARIHHMLIVIQDLDFGGLMRLMVETALVGMTDVPCYVNDISTPSQLLDAARRYGLDPAAVNADLEASKAKSAKKEAPENLNLPIEAAQAGEGNATTPEAGKASVEAAQAQGLSEPGKAKKQAATAARKENKTGQASPARGTKKQKVPRAPASSQKRGGETAKLFDEAEGASK